MEDGAQLTSEAGGLYVLCVRLLSKRQRSRSEGTESKGGFPASDSERKGTIHTQAHVLG